MTSWVPERSYSVDIQKVVATVVLLAMVLVLVDTGLQSHGGLIRCLSFLGAALAGATAVAGSRVRLDVCPAGVVVVSALRSRRVRWSEIGGFEVVSSNANGGRCLGIRLVNGRLLKSRAVAHFSSEKVQALSLS